MFGAASPHERDIIQKINRRLNMKNGTCLKCNSSNIYFKAYELDKITLDGKAVEYANFVCTDCGYFETFITDKEALSKIVTRAEKLKDWKKVK
jgi:RNase P subunit RPR2